MLDASAPASGVGSTLAQTMAEPSGCGSADIQEMHAVAGKTATIAAAKA
jgi:hypothetical protein